MYWGEDGGRKEKKRKKRKRKKRKKEEKQRKIVEITSGSALIYYIIHGTCVANYISMG